MTNHFIKTIPLRVWVRVIGILLAVLYAGLTVVSYWTIGPRNIIFGLYFGSLISIVGSLYRREWARKMLIMINGIGIVLIIGESIWFNQQVDGLSILFGVLFLSTIILYQQPFVKSEFVVLPRFRSSSSWKILLIDDDKILSKMLTRSFLQHGIVLLTADTGERGLAVAQREKLDLIILDVILPKMKGREVCQRLKEDSRTKDIPIIFLTVQNSPEDIQAEMDAGAVSHLTKPVDFPAVYKEITKILGE